MTSREEVYARAAPAPYVPALLTAPLLVAGGPEAARLGFILAAAGLVPVALASRLPDIAQASGVPWDLHRHVAVLRLAASAVHALFLLTLAGAAPEALGDPVRAALTATLAGAAAAYVLPRGDRMAAAGRGERLAIVAGAARRAGQLLLAAAGGVWLWVGLLPAVACCLAAVAATLTVHTCRRVVRGSGHTDDEVVGLVVGSR